MLFDTNIMYIIGNTQHRRLNNDNKITFFKIDNKQRIFHTI